MIRLSATKAELTITETETITSGAQRVFECAFTVNSDWDGLNRTAVFRAGTKAVSVLLGDDNTAEIPWEVLQTAGITLRIGLYGTNAAGDVLPTVWADAGMICTGAYLGDDAYPPTPGAYEQLVEIAKNAEKIAQSVRDDADKGAFDGEPGKDGVQIDDAAVSSTETWSSRKIIDTLCPEFSVSGNPVTVTPVEGYPLGAVVILEPKQAGSGDPSPDNIRPITGWDEVTVTRCGKNLVTAQPVIIESGAQTVVDLGKDLYFDSVTVSFRCKNLTMKTSGSACIDFLLSDGTHRYCTWWDFFLKGNHIGETGNSDGVATLTKSNITFCKLNVYWNTANYSRLGDETELSELQLELGSTPTPYEPYQPGTTSTLTLPETIYGGTVDAVTGVGSKTWGYIASYNGESLPGEWISDRDVYAAGTTPTVGAQVAYKLAAPEPFQVTGNQPIPALAGENTVYTDGNSLAVSGRSDPTAYIQQQISDAITAAVAITGGT